ncbi:uncharacterized protein EKO05_0007039 [Ascochyta rabiei]|nr:uncharacterized protein EKO05_0007039 [Ascochyta rabiei]UPX16649.1 hypothetical protein EKO05_0007039 [Ascochyta rabiei]
MASNDSSSGSQKRSISLRTTLRSRRKRLEEEGSRSDDEAVANGPDQHQRQHSPRRCSPRSRLDPFAESVVIENPNTAPHTNSSLRGRAPRSSLFARQVPSRAGTDSAIGSPSRVDLSSIRAGPDTDDEPGRSLNGLGCSSALQDGVLEDNLLRNHANPILRRIHTRSQAANSQPEASAPQGYRTDAGLLGHAFDNFDSDISDRASRANTFERSGAASTDPFGRTYHTMGGPSKRTRERFEDAAGKDLLNTLKKQGAVTAMIYHDTVPDSEANDIWPKFRSSAKLPIRYSMLDTNGNTPEVDELSGRGQKTSQNRYNLRGRANSTSVESESQNESDNPPLSRGRPFWQLPVELVEQIIEHLNRDDIKSLRLVSHELNDCTSQAAFKTVVVPFNMEIYGMLGQEPKPDRKGKKCARISKPEYWWRNGNCDEAYVGHSLDVFRGFGRHIVRYAMSFEVTETSLSAPPLKPVTEQKTSFWGKYEWPFGEYRRFDAIAGLESAADETPRMKTAFSELTKVKELALSIDNGLGWLNGPDRSIRAHILQKPPSIFGCRRKVPDRRAQAQQELWDHIDTMHARVGEDVRIATLFKLEGGRPLIQAQETGLLATVQPTLPFLDAHIVHDAKPQDITNSDFSETFGDSDLYDRHMPGQHLTNAGVLFTSTTLQPSDAAQVASSITPATLSKLQSEWLLETEWAQRAFTSSYMLSILDNPATFHQVHTLNISSLPDRYISMLNRADFWNALPNLKHVTLMIVPGWRTVYKDEAGFVDTSVMDPTERVDIFCELLLAQIASRPTIKKLTIGFTTGGEHAEGLHARNKLLMPAPLLPLEARMHADPLLPTVETALVQDGNILQQALLRFPYLEEFTLRNCWITPSALLEFVKIHDKYCLKHLNMDSVSLTAMLRPIGNAHAAQQANPQNAAVAQQLAVTLLHFNNNNNGGGNAAQAHPLPANNQVLNSYIQSLIVQLQQMQANAGGIQQQHINALQNQLQQQLHSAQIANAQPHRSNRLSLRQHSVQQHPQAQQQLNITHMTHLNHLATQVSLMQQLVAGQGALVAPFTNAPADGARSVLQTRPREGSWMEIIDQISPGTNLFDFESPHSQAIPTRTTSLQCVSFISCGYAKLPHLHPGIDQSTIETGNGFAAALRNPVFTKRYNALSPAMLSSRWPYLGEIVQEVDSSELAALETAWDLRHGWEDVEAARAVEFDGLLSGGTGRFSGKVQLSDRVNTGANSAS